MSEGEILDVGSLLTIDVESELRKLTMAQLQGPWQLPAELVRRAVHGGAKQVEVELGRAQLRVRSRGDAIPLATLRELAALLDPKRPAERRHRALSTLERAGALSLLGLVGLEPAALKIVSPAATPDGEAVGLSWVRGGEVELQRFGASKPTHVEVIVRGPKLDRARAREWLVSVARYAAIEIVIDGQRLAVGRAGFENAFAVVRVNAPLPATIALVREGEVARLYLLQDGLVSTHVSVPDAPCFEAAIEAGDLAEPTAGASRLRDVIQPWIRPMVEAAIDVMIRRGQAGAGLSTADRTRLTQLLLTGARRNREQAKTIARLPLFRVLERDGRERWCDLLAMRESVHDEGGERLLTALFPDQDPADFAPEDRVFVLDDSERALLAELLELGFRQPRRRVEARRRHPLRELATLLRGGGLFAALRPGGQPIPDAELSPEQRSFLIQLRAQFEGCEITMCTGSGPVRRFGAGPRPTKLLLPRGSDRVKAAVVAVADDPSWVYPALLSLLGGRDFPARARRRWSIARLSG
jgi:hypothetical protein